MRRALAGVMLMMLAGCSSTPYASSLMFGREIGNSIAHATVVAGAPDSVQDLADGRRAYRWQRPSLVPFGGPLCVYTIVAVSEGRRESLAAWRIVEMEKPPGCA
jgi:hypothetical protein